MKLTDSTRIVLSNKQLTKQAEQKQQAELKAMKSMQAWTVLQTHDETERLWYPNSAVCILQTPISKNVLNIFRNNSVARVYSKFSNLKREGVLCQSKANIYQFCEQNTT